MRCPTDKPVFTSDRCEPCPTGLYFNISIEGCQECSGGRNYIKERNICECPANKPFFTEVECIECYLPKYFDF